MARKAAKMEIVDDLWRDLRRWRDRSFSYRVRDNARERAWRAWQVMTAKAKDRVVALAKADADSTEALRKFFEYYR